MGKFIDVTTETFDKEVVESGRQVLVDFWAPWCGPCRMQTPILERLAKAEDVDVDIAKLNTDENPEIAQKLGIISIPTLILYQDGKEVDRFVGVQPEEVLREKLS